MSIINKNTVVDCHILIFVCNTMIFVVSIRCNKSQSFVYIYIYLTFHYVFGRLPFVVER
ncbi:hypothetical protein AB4K20DRAFT_1879315 [Rhizopus microsporus]